MFAVQALPDWRLCLRLFPHLLGEELARADGKRRPAKALSAQSVQAAKASGKYSTVMDFIWEWKRTAQGFGFSALRFKANVGKLEWVALNVVSLAELCEKALDTCRMSRAGGDTIQAKRETKAVLTFEQAAHKVFSLYAPPWSNAKHTAQSLNVPKTYIFPRIGHMNFAQVGSGDLVAVLTPNRTEKSETARKVGQKIGRFMK